jgi:hypothetical protein
VTDIFSEVDEEIRRERLKKLWDRYGTALIALAVVIVVGVGGWRGYQWWEARRAAEAGASFDAAAQLVEQGQIAEAEAAFARLAADTTTGYRVLARLRAAEAIGQRDPAAAVAAYDAIANDSSLGQVMRDLATVRSGLLLVDTASYADLAKRLEPAAEAARPFRHTARELLALSAWKASDTAAAKKWVETIQGDPDTPQSLRARVEVIPALIGDSSKG